MSTATDLRLASFRTASQLNLAWFAGTLDTKLAAFNNSVSPLFDDGNPPDRPVGNWLVLLEATASQMPSTNVPFSLFNAACNEVARICMAGYVARADGRISIAQSTALLAAWNTQFGT